MSIELSGVFSPVTLYWPNSVGVTCGGWCIAILHRRQVTPKGVKQTPATRFL